MEPTENLVPDIQLQLPENFEVPILHEKPKTTLDSLLQIKNEFDTKIEDAMAKNDAGKKRRYQRQSKLFEEAIKATKEGKTFNYNELVVPPGFAQIPLQRDGRPVLHPTAAASKPKPPPPHAEEAYDNTPDDSDDFLEQLEREIENEGDEHDVELDADDEQFNRQMREVSNVIPGLDKLVEKNKLEEQVNAFKIPEPRAVGKVQPRPTTVVSPSQPVTPNAAMGPKQSKELTVVLERQRLFKQAAVKAKAEGNINVALTYLKLAKGFDTMIQGAQNGLPLDMNNLPVPPQMQEAAKKKSVGSLHVAGTGAASRSAAAGVNSVEIIDEPIAGDRQAVYKQLMTSLREQVEIATENYKHYTNMGDIGNANKFNKIARESIQDLEALRNANKLGEPVPLYHYEKRTYETIDCNSDLTDNDLELTIVRAINLPIPKDMKADSMNTFVKFEFPYPPEQEQTDKTKTQNGNCNPEYNQKFKLQIQRKQPKFVRLMNRKELKLELFLYRGMLRSDRHLATCHIKLQALENSSTIHSAFELLEGRRQTGAKVEVKLRIREPLLHKEVLTQEHKWLIIDKFERSAL